MINVLETLQSDDSHNEQINKAKEVITFLNSKVDEATEFFRYVQNNNLGYEKLQPHINNLREYIEENRNRLNQYIKDKSEFTPEQINEIESYQQMLKDIENKINEFVEVAQENGDEFEVAGSLD